MSTWVALLRGIDVGGSNRLAMADRRATHDHLGATDVSTYLQSGNAVAGSRPIDSWWSVATLRSPVRLVPVVRSSRSTCSNGPSA